MTSTTTPPKLPENLMTPVEVTVTLNNWAYRGILQMAQTLTESIHLARARLAGMKAQVEATPMELRHGNEERFIGEAQQGLAEMEHSLVAMREMLKQAAEQQLDEGSLVQ
jgi:hypothetical protein